MHGISRRGARVVESARLESELPSKAVRGFESHPLRQTAPRLFNRQSVGTVGRVARHRQSMIDWCASRIYVVNYGVNGEVREWLNRPVSKTGIPFGVSRVRIPPSPPGFVWRARASGDFSTGEGPKEHNRLVHKPDRGELWGHWRGAGVVESAGLENRYTPRGIESSNPLADEIARSRRRAQFDYYRLLTRPCICFTLEM